MPLVHPIFDTQIYRTLNSETAQVLKDEERAKSVVALASYWPVIELAAHLANPADTAHTVSRRALGVLWRHTHQYDGSRYVVPLLADAEAQLASSLYDRELPNRANEAQAFGYAVGLVGDNASGPLPSELSPFFALMREHVEARELRFEQDMRALAQGFDSAAEGWQPFASNPEKRKAVLSWLRSTDFLHALAKLRAQATADQVGLTVGEDELVAMGKELSEVFPTAFYFYRNLLIGLVESGTDFSLSKHRNSIWDLQLSFTVSPRGTINGVPTILVSNDKHIRRAAKDAGHEHLVMSLDEYRASLQAGNIEDLAGRLREAARE